MDKEKAADAAGKIRLNAAESGKRQPERQTG
jgi:hypothetical protein